MTCQHTNIHWEDLFKPKKQNNLNYKHKNAHCLDCGTEKGRFFANSCRIWFCKKVREWLTSTKEELIEKDFGNRDPYISFPYGDFDEFVKKNNFEKQWKELQTGSGDWYNECFEGIFGQSYFWETARSIEYLCQEFKKEKEQERSNNNNDNNIERERERERERETKITEKDKEIREKT